MITEWEERDNYWTNISSLDFDQCLKYRGYSVNRRHESYNYIGHMKNLIRKL